MPYRVEYAKSKRAGCKAPACKKNQVKIEKGELRFGVWVEYQEGTASWSWRHWGCVTPKQCKNLQENVKVDYDQLDGYEELTDDDRARIRQALAKGHIADEDLHDGINPEDNRDQAAIKAAEKEAKRAHKEAEKAEKQAAKEALKAAKEAEREVKKAEKDSAKEAKKARNGKTTKFEENAADDSNGNATRTNRKRARTKQEDDIKEEFCEEEGQISTRRKTIKVEKSEENMSSSRIMEPPTTNVKNTRRTKKVFKPKIATKQESEEGEESAAESRPSKSDHHKKPKNLPISCNSVIAVAPRRSARNRNVH